MFKLIARLFLWSIGWKLRGRIPKEVRKSVMIAAPHTSTFDFFIARSAFYLLDVPVRFLIKKEVFFFPLGFVLRKLGGIPVDRGQRQHMVQHMIELLKLHNDLVILITPEATRKRNPKWKKGFYHVATGADVPIVMGYADFKKKETGIGPILYPSGNFEKDAQTIINFYKKMQGKYPDKYAVGF